MARPPLPPFTWNRHAEGAHGGGRLEHPRPGRVASAYTEDSRWRNRAEFFQGRPAIVAFLRRKWARELDYRLIKELWAFHDNRIAVRFHTNGTTIPATGFARMATSSGNSTTKG